MIAKATQASSRSRTSVPRCDRKPWKVSFPLTIILFCASGLCAQAGLPSRWSDADIGSPAHASHASGTSAGWTIAGGGAPQPYFRLELVN